MAGKLDGKIDKLWRWRSCATFLVFLAACASSPAAEEVARVLIVFRQGLLAPEEISPRSQGDAPALWKLALEGTSVAELETPRDLSPSAGPAQVAKLLLPESVRNSGDDWLLLELKASVKVWSGEPPAGAGLPFEELYTVVGPSRPAKKSEKKEEDGAGKKPPGDTQEPEKESATRESPAGEKVPPSDPIAASRVTIVRVRSSLYTQDLVHGRDRFLAHLVDKVGQGAYVFVVNHPDEGAGSLVAKGPLLKKGKVLGRKKSFSLMESALAYLFQDSGKRASQHELFE